MKFEDKIITYIKENPGISAKKIASYLDSNTNNLLVTEGTNSKAKIFKQLRTLRRKGNIYNRGDRWYFMNRNNIKIGI